MTQSEQSPVAESPPANAPQRRRRWFQFSLRTLLILTAGISIWAAIVARSVHRQKAAIAAVKRLGGWAYYDYQLKVDERVRLKIVDGESSVPPWLLDWLGRDFFHDIAYVNMAYDDAGGVRKENQQLGDEIKNALPMLPKLRKLLLMESQVTDECLRAVGDLHELEVLLCAHAREATDQGVAALANLKRLRILHLSSGHPHPEVTTYAQKLGGFAEERYADATGKITDESLRIVAQLPELESLSMQFNAFTDEGLKHIRGLTNLKQLNINHGKTRISDHGLRCLHGLSLLETVDLQYCQVTDEGVAELRKALPNLTTIYR